MRVIKFRAKRVDNGFWACGHLIKTPITAEFNDANGAFFDSSSAEKTEWSGRWCIVQNCVAHEVDPTTIGQFTGQVDKDNNEIYEGDILVRSHDATSLYKAVIEFRNGMFGGETTPYAKHFIEMKRLPKCDYDQRGYDLIISNIHSQK